VAETFISRDGRLQVTLYRLETSNVIGKSWEERVEVSITEKSTQLADMPLGDFMRLFYLEVWPAVARRNAKSKAK
jgi:hypothetical protein